MRLEKEIKTPISIFVTGASGLVGCRLVDIANQYEHSTFSPGHVEFDIAKMSQDEIFDYLSQERPNFVINSAAIADVDWCENPENREIVWETNVNGPRKLAIACLRLGIPLGQISTDYVFDGERYPLNEGESISPVNSVYAESKAEAERQLDKVGGKVHIIRIQRPFGDDVKRDMIRDALHANMGGKTFYGIIDQMITPIYVTDLARAVLNIMRSQEYGIWHVSSSTPVSPYEFVEMAFEEFEKHGVTINWDLFREGKFDDFKDRWKAVRPRHTAYDISKYESRFGKLRKLREQVKECTGKIAVNLQNV